MLRKNFSIHIINHHLLYIRPIMGMCRLKYQILGNGVNLEL